MSPAPIALPLASTTQSSEPRELVTDYRFRETTLLISGEPT